MIDQLIIALVNGASEPYYQDAIPHGVFLFSSPVHKIHVISLSLAMRIRDDKQTSDKIGYGLGIIIT